MVNFKDSDKALIDVDSTAADSTETVASAEELGDGLENVEAADQAVEGELGA